MQPPLVFKYRPGLFPAFVYTGHKKAAARFRVGFRIGRCHEDRGRTLDPVLHGRHPAGPQVFDG